MIAEVNRTPWLALRWLLRILLIPLFLARGFRVIGASRLPTSRRALIIVSNHAAFVDTLYFVLAIRPRFTVCGAKPRLFRNPALRALMALGNILRVESQPQFLQDGRELLQRQEILLVYPEMGRFPDGMIEFKTWAAELALATQTPLLPCYLYGTTRGQVGRTRLIVGEPIEPRGAASELTAELFGAVRALCPTDAPVLGTIE